MPKERRIEIYLDTKKEPRARTVAANNKIVFVTPEGYRNKADLLKQIHIWFGDRFPIVDRTKKEGEQ